MLRLCEGSINDGSPHPVGKVLAHQPHAEARRLDPLTEIREALLFFAFMCALVLFVACLNPPSASPPQRCDNTTCSFDGYPDTVSVRGQLRPGFSYEGGQCRCDCEGIDIDLLCDVKPPTCTSTKSQ